VRYIIRKPFKISIRRAQCRIFNPKGLNFSKMSKFEFRVRHVLQTSYLGFCIRPVCYLKNRLDHLDRMILRCVIRINFFGECRLVFPFLQERVHAAFDLLFLSAVRVFSVTRGHTYRADIPR